MIRVLFFARVRDLAGCSELDIEFTAELGNVAKVMEHLGSQSEQFFAALSDPKMLVALNQEMAQPETTVEDGDEIAFFPPVTGG